MMEQVKKTYWQKWKVPVIIVGVFLLLILSIRVAVQSNWFFQQIRSVIITQAEMNLNGTLEIESMQGDLLRGFVIHGLEIKDAESTILSVDSLTVQYRLMNMLFSPHEIDRIELKGANLMIREEQDSTWNVLNLLKEGDDADKERNLYWKFNQLVVSNFSTDIRSETWLPEGFLSIENLRTDISAGFIEDGFFGTIKQLEFQLHDGKLPDGIGIDLTASAGDGIVTLESLLLDTGRSFLSATAELEQEDQLEADVVATAISWSDLLLYVEDMPLRQDLSVEIGASGTLDNLQLNLTARSVGLELMQLGVGLGFGETFSISSLSVELNELNVPVLTGMDDLPVLSHLLVTGSGTIIPGRIEETQWAGTIETSGFVYNPHRFDRLETDYSLNQGELNIEGMVAYSGQRVRYSATVTELFDSLPKWSTEVASDGLNLATWLNNEEYESDLNLRIDLTGNGLTLEQFNSKADISINGNQFGGQLFDYIHFTGDINTDELTGLLNAKLDRSELEANFDISSWIDHPDYRFSIRINEFNTAELSGFEDFPTYINGLIEGEGSGIELDRIQMMASATFDSSIVNGEIIETFTADFRVADQFLFVDKALLESSIADASFSLQQHLDDYMHRDNRLQFIAELKDIFPLAPLVGVERLESEGTLTGQVARNMEGILEFNGEMDLERVVVDTLFSSDEINGSLHILVKEEPELNLAINLKAPIIYYIEIQDMQIRTNARFEEEYTHGQLGFTISNGNQSSFIHNGDFSYKPDEFSLYTTEIGFHTDLRTLTLEQPFKLTFIENILRSDTLTISTNEDDSRLSLWIPHADSLHQEIGLEASHLNLGNLQQTFLEESYFEGFLSGRVDFKNSENDFFLLASGLLSEFGYEGGEMDSLRFDLQIKDEWLDAELNGWHRESKLADISLRIPYLPGDPLTFDDQFFERPVEGHFELAESELSYWLSFLPDGGPDQTDGKISIIAEMSGHAGSPDLSGQLTVEEGLFSGVRIDQINVDLSYIHEEAESDISGLIIKDRQEVLRFNSRLPFLVDLKQAELVLPSDDDEVFVNLQTNDFDLSALNNYLDPSQYRNLTGRLNGDMTLSGQLSNLESEGGMSLTRGSIRVVPLNINITEIRANVLFDSQRVVLEQFSMRSSPGTVRATGTVNLENLSPEGINIDITANQFRVANTQDTNAMINGQAKFTGTVEDPVLNGSITFLNGHIFLQNFGERSVEAVTLDEESDEPEFEFFDALAMELSVSFGRQFFVRNRQYLDLEIELGGQLDLLKGKNEEIQVFGTLEGLRGYARPLGKNFELEQAVISFFGPPENPQLNIITQHEPPQAVGVTIFYIIDGTLEDPEFRFESQPELELQDIISYTLFGKPFYELESWEQVVAGSGSSPTAADYALEVLLDRVEMLASQRLGIDVVQIDNTRAGTSNTTTIKTGWYLNRRTFFALLNEVGGSRPQTLFLLEYLLTENLELIILQGDDSREGIDLKWKLDY